MSATIECHSEPGKGSQFWFELNLPYSAQKTKSIDSGTEVKVEKEKKDIKSLRILVAEDNEDNQLLMRVFFKKLGLKFKLAENGLEALQEVTEKTYDLIFMDVHMPEMDGLEATRRIRSVEKSRRTHQTILALTALSTPDDIERCMESGMDGHISKPIQLQGLSEILEKWR
jgi:CheY-like chemotaxis protein